jgi:uncharacterized protein YjiK
MTLRRFFLVLLLLLLALAAYLMRWDARVLLWIDEARTTPEMRAANLWLPDYSAVLQSEIPGMEKEEFSDLAYNPATNTLLTVSGKTPLLIELSLQGKVLRSIPVIGAANMEGVAVMDDGLIAITDERQHSLFILRLQADTSELRIDQALQRVDLGYADDANKGFEGLAWDRANQRLLLGKEKRPLALYSLPTDGQKVTGEPQVLRDLGGIMTDLAGLTVDPRSGHVLALSQESHLLVELSGDYQPSNFIALLRGLHGLEHFIPQAEGVALDADDNLYIVSERNLFYVFSKQSAAD